MATHIFVRTEDLTKDFKLKNPKYIKEADKLVRYYEESVSYTHLLIDGKAISEQVKQEIASEVAEMVAHGEKRPHLAAILVGHDLSLIHI